MKYLLWRYLLNDDVDSFRQYLAKATFERNASRYGSGANAPSFKIGSPGSLATSPRTPVKSKKSAAPKIVLTRSDINARDGLGRTLLHHIVSSRSDDALEFLKILLEVPLLDLYIQDTESGWTALHRALYFGNIAAAQALMLKDVQNATDYTTNVSHTNAGGLVKIKDHEGNSPFEVLNLTTAPRDLRDVPNVLESAEVASNESFDMDDGHPTKIREIASVLNLSGDEVFAFGSNKNITLGLGDGDDRTFPERIQLVRPDHLSQRLFEDFQKQRAEELFSDEIVSHLAGLQELPAVVKNTPIVVQAVVMSKLHTAILTSDPISNLHICGFGPGGRLGTGDEATRFTFACIQAGGMSKRKVSSIALGQDHSVAVCTSGEVFTWGSNKYGQLGYELPEVSSQDTPLQLIPRQIYGLIKKEQIIGAAASSFHSAIYTSSGLYTFGKNDGQLGLMDADARSLELQVIPRRIGVSIIQHPIHSVEAIDRATTVLMENHEVIVFTHFGWTKINFPLDSFGSSIASDAFFLRHKRQTKHICKITSGGNTICALTSYGEVFTVDVPRHVEPIPNKSTTNPNKARNALPTPAKVWSIRKSHMSAVDAAVGQDGSIILCTAAGTVWQKEKRAKIKSSHPGNAKTKDYKFVRVPNIFGAVAVRSNSFGAFMAIRKDCDVMREQIVAGPITLWNQLFQLLAFRQYGEIVDEENSEEPQLRFWKPALKGPSPALIKRALLMNSDAEKDFLHIAARHEPLSAQNFDIWVTSNVTEVRLPVHSLVLKARSKILRRALTEFSESYYFSIPDVLSIEYGSDGQISIQFQGADFLTITNLVLYLYTDALADVWRFTSKALHLAPRYRAVRIELMKVALALDMKNLERAVRIMDEPVRCLQIDFDTAFHDSDLFSDADVVIDLADGEERYAHSVILQSRCLFFEGLFHGHTGGMWLADRRKIDEDEHEAVRVDLTHISSEVFEIVLRHIYADSGEELFDTVVTKNLDKFVDLVIEVMAVANELMLERLGRICQKVIGKYVTPWNICGLLNTIAESSEIEFKQAALEYIGLNLENMLDQRLLEELDEYLLTELNQSIQSNQLAFMPIARSDRVLDVLLEQDPSLAEQIEIGKQRRVDSMRLPSRYTLESFKPNVTPRLHSKGPDLVKEGSDQGIQMSIVAADVASTPTEEMPFEMDDDSTFRSFRSRSIPSPSPSPMIQAMSPTHLHPHTHEGGPVQELPEEDHELTPSSLGTTPRVASVTDNANVLPDHKTTPRSAWSITTTSVSGLGFKDIMLQDSSKKVSSLTQSLKQAAATKTGTARMSQKERKRQLHEQKTQSQTQLAESEAATKVAEQGTNLPQSPWQKLSEAKPTRPKLQPVQSEASASHAASSITSKPSSQTKSSSVIQPQAPDEKKSNRSVSTPGMTGASNAPPPQIQSVRHLPAPNRSSSWLDARTPMADILAQQQYEKRAIRETAAKRSLQEIQQEQEFQEWWDLESQRVQQEEAAASAAATRPTKSGRGRGSRRKASGRGDSKSSEPVAAHAMSIDGPVIPQTPVLTESSSRGKSKSRGRGGFRGGRRGQISA